jgi:hypothetical protein
VIADAGHESRKLARELMRHDGWKLHPPKLIASLALEADEARRADALRFIARADREGARQPSG